MAQAFYYSADNDLKAVALTLYSNSAPLLLTWYRANGYQLSSGVLALVTGLSGITGAGYAGGVQGSGVTDMWAVQENGDLVYLASGSPASGYPAPSGAIFTGITMASGFPYAVDATSGTCYTVSGSSVLAVTPSFGSTPARYLGASGATLYSLLPAATGVGTLALATQTTGASGFISVPLLGVGCMAVGSGLIAVGGFNATTIASGAQSIALEPGTAAQLLAVRTTAGALDIYNAAAGFFTYSASVTGLGSPPSVSWTPDDQWGVVPDPVGGHLNFCKNTFGSFALTQQLAISGVTQALVSPDAVHGLALSPGTNSVTPLVLVGSVWTSGVALSLADPLSIASTGPSGMAVGFASGVAYFSLATTGTWSQTGSAALGFAASQIASDPATNGVFVGGTQSGSGLIALVSGASVLASGAYGGSCTGVLAVAGQYIALDGANNLMRDSSYFGGLLTQQTTTAIPSGASSIILVSGALLVAASGQIAFYDFTQPFTLTPQPSGMVSIRNGGSWYSAAVCGVPTALAIDPSGNVSVATNRNYLATVNATGGVNTQASLNVTTGQASGVNLGVSSLLWFGNKLYAGSAVADTLMELV